MHKGCAHWSRSLRDPNQKNSDEKTGASSVPPKYKVPQWASHLDLAMVVFCCQLPESAGRMERIFTSKTAPGIYSISPFNYFSPYFTITGFQSCYSVSGRGGCNRNVAGVNYRDLKYWAVSSRVSLSYLLPVLTLALLLFLANSSSSLSVYSPPASPSLLWSLKKPLVCLYFSSNSSILPIKSPSANYSFHFL